MKNNCKIASSANEKLIRELVSAYIQALTWNSVAVKGLICYSIISRERGLVISGTGLSMGAKHMLHHRVWPHK